MTKTEKAIQQMETWDRKNLPPATSAQVPAIPVEQVPAVLSPRLLQISLFMLLSVFSGAAAFDSIKNFRVIIGISISCFLCHKAYGFAGVQVLQASFNTIFLKKGKKGRIHMSFEQSGTFTFTEMYKAGNVFQSNLVHVILFDVGNDFFDSVIFHQICSSRY